MFDFFNEIISNDVFLSAFWGWLAAQFIKTVIGFVYNFRMLRIKKTSLSEEEKEDFNMMKDMMSGFFWKTGGMPSSHTSMSAALTMALGFEEGFTSNLFIVAFFFTGIVVRDASGVRQLAGRLARRTNVLVSQYNKNSENLKKMNILKVVEGHTVSEVFVGIALGIAVSVIICVVL